MAAQQFVGFVNSRRAHCRFERGEWHIPDYQGISVARGTIDSDGYRVSRSAAIQDQAQLTGLMQGGRAIIDAATQSFENAGVQLNLPKAADTPIISVQPSELPPMPPAPVGLLPQLTAEVNNSRKDFMSYQCLRILTSLPAPPGSFDQEFQKTQNKKNKTETRLEQDFEISK